MKVIRRLLALFRPYWHWIALAIGLSLASVLANIALMATAGWFITAMGLAGLAGVTMNYFTPAAMIRAFAIIRTGGRYAERFVGHEATFRLLAVLRTWFYERIEPLAPAGLQSFRSGDLLTRIRNDIDRLELFFLRLLAPAAVALIASLIVVAVLSAYDPLIGLVQLGLFALAGMLLPLAVAEAGAEPSERITVASARLNMLTVDTIEGQAELHLYGHADSRAARIEALSDEMIADETRLAGLSAISQAGIGLAANLAMAFALLIAIPDVTSGRLAAPELAMLAFLALASFEAVAPVPLAMQSLSGTLASARRLFAIADAAPPVLDPSQPKSMPDDAELRFENVSLTYSGARHAALTGINLRIAPGRRVAVIGPSGSGKSSLVNLALRFWEPSEGCITIGGVPIHQLKAEDLRRRISVVSQHAHLFAATVAENLLVANPRATSAEIEAACRLAQIHDFIVAQPDGYGTYVGTNGLKLSGGEARRLAVARALLKKAPILLLDEPTEGVDSETEHTLLNAVLEARRDCAVLLITHRPAALEKMDEILALDAGRILERRTRPAIADHPRSDPHLPPIMDAMIDRQ